MQHTLSTRLTDVRSLATLSQADLAKKVGVSPSLVSMWEKGARTPSADQLVEIARQLGVAVDYLLNAEVRPRFQCRAKVSPDAEQSPAIERTLLDASQQIHFIDAAYRLAGKAPRPLSLWADFPSAGEVPDLTARMRETLRLNRRVTLAEMKQALSEWNVFVFEWNMPWHLSGMSFRGAFTVIFINHEHYPTRRLFTLAHELGHVLFHLGRKTPESAPEDTVVSLASSRDPLEKQANAFASELLMPTSEIERLMTNYGKQLKWPSYLESVARSFNVSRDALFYRLSQAGLFRWNERSRFFSGQFATPPPPEQRVERIEEQVDPAFRETALSLLQTEKITTGKLAQWFFAQRHVVDAYLLDLAKDVELAISDENGHEEGVIPPA